MRKATKIVISFAVLLIAGLNFIVPAFAQDPFTAIAIGGLTGASGAGLFGSMAGMSGINIAWGNNTADQMDAMWNVLNPDHVYFTGEKHEATGIDEDVYDYITVDIGDWLSAQTEFISEFCDNYQVDDNDFGTATSTKNYYGYPFTNGAYGDAVGTATVGNAFSKGAGAVSFIDENADYLYYSYSYNGGSVARDFTSINYKNCPVVIYYSGNSVYWAFRYNNTNVPFAYMDNSSHINNNSSVDWTSETVNLSVFDGWESAKVKIPHSISQLQPGWTPVDFFNELDRIWYGSGEDNIIIEDGAQPVPPVPVPTTPLGEVPFDDWIDLWGQGIYQQLENQSDALDFIGSNGTDAIEELESIDENIGALEETAESIDTNIGIGNGLLGGIKSLAESAVDYLEGIAEHVGELVEEIVAGTETLIAGILNQIPQAFGVIFGPIKQASSIWHYVVEWITSIGAPFQFIWSMASGTSYYIILPVYASLAAAVVLAFFKRFGR